MNILSSPSLGGSRLSLHTASETIATDEQAWQVVFVSMRSFQIELSWKYEKSKLAFQSPRVYKGEAREKVLLLEAVCKVV